MIGREENYTGVPHSSAVGISPKRQRLGGPDALVRVYSVPIRLHNSVLHRINARKSRPHAGGIV